MTESAGKRKRKPCYGCEHVHAPGVECQTRTPAANSNWAPKCGCMEGR